MTRRIGWLHISDLHFTAGETWNRRATLRALVRLMEKDGLHDERGEPLAVDLVFVTGDIAQSGKSEEYKVALTFFQKLATAVKLDPKQRFFIVPGNHDVDRGEVKRGRQRGLRALANEDEIEDVLLHDRESLDNRMQAFYDFSRKLLGAKRAFGRDALWRTDTLTLHGLSLGILQLNSAWTSAGDDDRNNLLVGEAQVREALDATEQASLRVALMHHPFDELREFDGVRVGDVLAAPGGATMLLRGHLHRTSSAVVRSPNGAMVQLAAGATYVGGSWPRTFTAGVLDLDARRVHVFMYAYSDRGGGFWHRDNSAYELARDGAWSFDLPAGVDAGTPSPAPAATEAVESTISFAATHAVSDPAHDPFAQRPHAPLAPSRTAEMPREKQLIDLLMSCFSTDELRAWISFLPDGHEVLASLPGPTASKAVYMFEAVEALGRRGMVDAEFFGRLVSQRKQRTATIVAVARAWGFHLKADEASQERDPSPSEGPDPEPVASDLSRVRALLVAELKRLDQALLDALAQKFGMTTAPVSAEEILEAIERHPLVDVVKVVNFVDNDTEGLRRLMCLVLPYAFDPGPSRSLDGAEGVYEVAIATEAMAEVARARADQRTCDFVLDGSADFPEVRGQSQIAQLPTLGPKVDGRSFTEAILAHLAKKYAGGTDRPEAEWMAILRTRLESMVDPLATDRRSLFYVVTALNRRAQWLVAIPKLREDLKALHFIALSTDPERLAGEERIVYPVREMEQRYQRGKKYDS